MTARDTNMTDTDTNFTDDVSNDDLDHLPFDLDLAVGRTMRVREGAREYGFDPGAGEYSIRQVSPRIPPGANYHSPAKLETAIEGEGHWVLPEFVVGLLPE
jgi:hypothetical protein